MCMPSWVCVLHHLNVHQQLTDLGISQTLSLAKHMHALSEHFVFVFSIVELSIDYAPSPHVISIFYKPFLSSYTWA